MKPITIGRSRTGLPTASAGNARIHSAYDPEKEARRFLDTLELENSGTVVLIGAGLGYLDAAIRQVFPLIRILAFHLEEDLFSSRIGDARESPDIRRWHPASPESPDGFLFRNLSEFEIPGLRVVEWPASVNTCPETAGKIRDSLAAVVRRYSGNITVTAAFGRLWLKNTLRNFIDTDRVASPPADARPVVIAASGPSLEEALPVMAEYRRRFRLWALSSSVAALTAKGLIPDLIFTTDPGFWAKQHTRFFPASVPVAMPLSAAPLPVGAGPPLVINQESLWESELAAAGQFPFLALPEMGTVAATALEAWKRIGRGNLNLVGLDLAWTDLQSHARPHGFDGWLESGTNRTNPSLTVAWDRARIQAPLKTGRKRTGTALRTYADWFSTNEADGRVVRFRSRDSRTERLPIPGVKEENESWFRGLRDVRTEGGTMEIRQVPLNRKKRIIAVRNTVERWKSIVDSQAASEPALALMYTLDPGGLLDAGRLRGKQRQSRMDRCRREVMELLEGFSHVYE